MTQKHIELYAFMHHMKNGILTVSPNQGQFGQVDLPINEISFIAINDMARMAVIRIPEWLAVGKGLTTIYQESLTGTPVPLNQMPSNQSINTEDFLKDIIQDSKPAEPNPKYERFVYDVKSGGMEPAQTQYKWPVGAAYPGDSDMEANHNAGFFHGYEVTESKQG